MKYIIYVLLFVGGFASCQQKQAQQQEIAPAPEAFVRVSG